MKLKSIAAAVALSAGLAAPAFADQAFDASDMQQLFGNEAQPTELAALSQQEMKDTEGAFFFFVLNYGGWYPYYGYAPYPYYGYAPYYVYTKPYRYSW